MGEVINTVRYVLYPMKIVDSEGKVFGKVNIIDLTVLLIVLSLIVLVIRTTTPNREISKGEWITREWITIELLVYNQPQWVVDALSLGDVMVDNNDVVIANITDIMLIKVNNDRKDLLLKVRIFVDKKNDRFVFQNKEIRINSPIFLVTEKIEFRGVIGAIGASNETKLQRRSIKRNVTVYMTRIDQWLVNSISVGEISVDMDDRIMAEIISKDVTPTEVEVSTDSGSLVKTNSLKYKDMTLTLSLLLDEEDGSLWYKNNQVKLGLPLEVVVGDVYIKGFVKDVS